MSAPMMLLGSQFSFITFIVLGTYFPYSVVTTGAKHKHFGSKTAYELIHPQPETIVEDEYNFVQVGTFSCLAAHSSVIARHGARHPGLKDRETISKIHNKIKDYLHDDSFKSLKEWTNNFPKNNDKSLMDKGIEEHFKFGQRTAKRLRTLFVDEDEENFRFLVSSTHRAQESANSFYGGFSESLNGEISTVDSEISDETLRFHEKCDKYVKGVEKNKTAAHEVYKFLDGKEMKTVLKKITTMLTVPEDLLTTDDVRTMYLLCGYESANKAQSPWCDLFDDEDIKILEYLSDLKHYYKNGHAYKIIAEQSCPLVTDIFTSMDDAIEALESDDDEEEMTGYVLGNFYFGHAETVGPLYAALGLFNDSLPLKADNFDQQGGRLFRTSQILSFSANLLLVLYECDQDEELLTEAEAADETRETTQYMLRMFVNEKPVKIPGCKDLTCTFLDVRKHYEQYIECNFRKVCSTTDRPKDEL